MALDKEQWATIPMIANQLAGSIMASYPTHGVSQMVTKQQDIAASNLATAKEEMAAKEAAKKKGGIAGGVGAALGAVGGFVMGGPAGAVMGAQAGNKMGQGVANKDYGSVVEGGVSMGTGISDALKTPSVGFAPTEVSSTVGIPAGYTQAQWDALSEMEKQRVLTSTGALD